MSFFLTHISQVTNHGTSTNTSETSTPATENRVNSGRTDNVQDSDSVLNAGSKVATNAVTSPGEKIAKSHYAMKMNIKIPIQNRQPIAND